jgi:hypothetical protein
MSAEKLMPPELKILFDQAKSDIFATLNCVQIGKIETVKASEQTVEIALQIRRLAEDDSSVAYPVLVDCPYFVLQGGGAYIDMPIAAGDYCLVLFNDRDIDNWWSTANVADPASTRKHSFSDAIALVGLNPKTAPLSMDGTKPRLIGPSGPGSEKSVARKGDTAKLTMSGLDIQALAVALLATGGFTPASAPAPAPSPLTFTNGEITGGSPDWKAT